jgi:hypothetical protein
VEEYQKKRARSRQDGGELVYWGDPDVGLLVSEAYGIALLEPTFDLLGSLPRGYLKRNVHITTLGKARNLPGPIFCKPADGAAKCFEAGVYSRPSEIGWPRMPPDSTVVLVSDPATFDLEYRCFVLKREVVALSPYIRHGWSLRQADGRWPDPGPELGEVTGFCEDFLGDPAVRTPPAVAIDIGRIERVGWVVVELNAAWGSGILGCDPVRVLEVLHRACVGPDRLSREDREWLIERSADDD